MAHVTRKMQVAKMLASSLVLLTICMIILIDKKHRLHAQKVAPTPVSLNMQLSGYTNINDFGGIISSSKVEIAHATVEHIALNVPKSSSSSSKIIRYGRVVHYPNAQATILICHGIMCDKFDVQFLRHMFPQGKFNFMTFDFRAHGENCEGQRCTLGRDEALDVITAAHFIKNHPNLKGKPVIAYGFSMGAVAAIEAQSQDNSLFSGMVLDCPFDSSENIIKRSLESLQFTFLGYDFSIPACNLLQKYAFHPYVQAMIKNILKTVSNFDTKNIDIRVYPISPADSIQKVLVPCCLIHCKNDEKVSVEAVKLIYENAGTPNKMLWLTNGRRHFDSYFYNPERYIKEVRSFIDNVIAHSFDKNPMQKIIEDPDELLTQI